MRSRCDAPPHSRCRDCGQFWGGAHARGMRAERARVAQHSRWQAWSIDALSFKMILMGKAQQDSTMYMDFLGKVDLLRPLTKEQLEEMAGCLKEKVTVKDQNIICEGDEGNTFYIITCAAPPRPAHDGAEARRRARRAER